MTRPGNTLTHIETFGSGEPFSALEFIDYRPGNDCIARPILNYTVSLSLPLSRLAFSTSRPPRVLILARNPCTRFR